MYPNNTLLYLNASVPTYQEQAIERIQVLNIYSLDCTSSDLTVTRFFPVSVSLDLSQILLSPNRFTIK